MSEHPAKTGEYELVEVIAEGGMGAVYRARDGLGEPVAVKLLRQRARSQSNLRRNFLREVEATAALNHPAIVRLLDAGFVDFRGQDTPWIAMELVEGGTLGEPRHDRLAQASLRGSIGWNGLRSALLTLLDALAHAHAHGVVHCDIKPSNVLLRSGDTVQPVLTDFGIARAQRSTEIVSAPTQQTSGTPPYMSPEQLMGDWRRMGPASDLYALGVTAWELTTGARPFQAERLLDLVQMVLREPLPLFQPAFAVPRGFEAWLHKLLSKNPYHRFAFAADAAVALASLSTEDLAPGESLVVDVATAETWVTNLRTLGESLLSITDTRFAVLDSGLHRALSSVQTFGTHTWPRPPVSRTWDDNALDTPDRLSIKQGLFGVRAVSLVGRNNEQQTLWNALVRVAEEERLEVIVVRGPQGIGKTHLCDWLCQRAHERGLAQVLTALHTTTNGRGTGMVPAMARHLGLDGLSAFDAVDRLEDLFESLEPVDVGLDKTAFTGLFNLDVADDKHGLGHLLGDRDADAEEHTNPLEQVLLFERTLRRLAISRPLVLRFEDAQFGPESVALVRHLLDAVALHDFPLLCIITRDERSANAAVERQLLSIESHPRASVLSLEPLAESHWPTLAGTLLPLDPHLRDRLARASRGFPTLAIQWLSDHLERNRFRDGPSGYSLDHPDFSWIESASQLWRQRIETVCAAFDDDREHVRDLLILAAMLGETVDGDEWSEAGVRIAQQRGVACLDLDEVQSSLLRRRLARRTNEGWQFVGGGLAAELAVAATTRADGIVFHGICADTLLTVHQQRLDPVAERAGWHAFHANRPALAVDLFIKAVHWRLLQTDVDEAVVLLDHLEDWVPDDSSLERLRLRQHRILVLINRGQYANAAELARSLQNDLLSLDSQDPQFHDVLLEASRLHGRACYRLGDYAGCIEAARSMAAQASRLDDRPAAIDALNLQGDAHYMLGERGPAGALYEQAHEECGDDIRGTPYAQTMLNLCYICMDAGEFERATRFGRKALSEQARVGNRAAVAGVISDLGTLAGRQDDNDAALACFKTSMWMFGTLGLDFHVPQFNVCELLMQAERFDEAHRELTALCDRVPDEAMKAAVLVSMASCNAQRGELTGVDQYLDRAEPLIQRTGIVFMTIAQEAKRTGDAAAEMQSWDLARRAWRIAESQLAQLDPDGELLAAVRNNLQH